METLAHDYAYMEGTEDATFRPTHFAVWPTTPASLPPAIREALVFNRDRDRLEYPSRWPEDQAADFVLEEGANPDADRESFLADRAEAPMEEIELPEDFCLREAIAIDPGDHEAVAKFVMEWGRLSPSGCGSGTSPLASLPTFGGGWLDDVEQRVAVASLDEQSVHHGFPLLLESHYLRRLRVTVLHWLAYQQGSSLMEVWRREGFACFNDDFAWQQWLQSINSALRPFTFKIEAFGENGQFVTGELGASTYEIAMLQLLRIVTASRELRTCANERCGALFTRQRGRTKYRNSGHDTGVLYCSHRCAKATAERARRARKKAARKSGGSDAQAR